MTSLRQLTRALRHRDFRLLWAAQSLSVIGDQIVFVALALFVIDLTGSATDLGLVLGAYTLPLIAFLLIGGVWADRLPRHRVMVVTDLVRFGLHGLLAVLIITGEVRIWHVVVIGIFFGTAEAFFRPAATGLLPQTVSEEEIQEANSINTASENLAEFLGPALATGLVLGLGAGAAFALDAATFLISAILLNRMRPRRRGGAAEAAAARDTLWAEMREGFQEVRSRAWVWVTLASFSVALCVGVAPWFVLGPLVAEDQYGGIAAYGVVAAAFGAGTIVGSVAALRWRPRFPMRLGLILILLWPPSQVLYAIGAPLPVTIPATILGGAGVAVFEVWWLTALAERIPPQKLSRVTSYDWVVSLGLLPLGYILAGPLADAFGAVEVLLAGSVLAAVVVALGLLPRETRMLERDAGAAAPPLSEPHPSFPG